MDKPEDKLPIKESMTVEFKSDRKCLSDRDLIEALSCLANSEGGELWLGVEDNGTPTGLHDQHKDVQGLSGLVASRTSPFLNVIVRKYVFGDVEVAKITVPKSQTTIATTADVYLLRKGLTNVARCCTMLHELARHHLALS